MQRSDTVKLLRECNAGCKNATDNMGLVLSRVKDKELRRLIREYNKEHVAIGDACHAALDRLGSHEKDPVHAVIMMAKAGSAMQLAMDNRSETAASIMHRGCSIGIRSLSRYLNEYGNANEESRRLAEDLIELEDSFERDLRRFL